MKYDRRIFLSLFWVVLGGTLFVCGIAEVIDSFWSGMGGGLVGAGLAQLVRHIRYRTSPQYREKIDISLQDERNKFLTGKAWAWAGYLFVLVSAVAVIALRVLGKPELSTAAGVALCLLLVLYWGSYMVLKRKY